MTREAAHKKKPATVEAVKIQKPRYSRILIKLSGEALMGFQEFGVDPAMMGAIARQVVEVHELGVEIAIVVGGGNIVRGVKVSEAGFDRATGDYMGIRMILPSLEGLRFKSELRMAFSMLSIWEMSQGWMVIRLGSGACRVASWLTGVGVP